MTPCDFMRESVLSEEYLAEMRARGERLAPPSKISVIWHTFCAAAIATLFLEGANHFATYMFGAEDVIELRVTLLASMCAMLILHILLADTTYGKTEEPGEEHVT